MRKIIIRFFIFTLFIAATVSKTSAAGFQIASNGEAAAVIVHDANPHRTIKLAAQELQSYFRKITTARLPIHNNAVYQNQRYIILGTPDSTCIKPAIKGKAESLLKQLKYDGYAVFVRGGRLYLVGNTPRGVLNGVHRFIYNHTDFIWFRPHKEKYNCTVNPDLTLEVKDHLDNPRFRIRSWLANARIYHHSEEFFIFCSRLGVNYFPRGYMNTYRDRYDDHGMFIEFGGGHDLSSRWLPKTVFGKTNPEFYMMRDGKRITSGRVQLCYSNEKMHEAFIAHARKLIAELPDYYSCVNMMIDDTTKFCECPGCTAPIKLPDGKVLTPADESYKSTLFFIFLNKVARDIAKFRPKLKIKCFGYFFTAIPPEIKIEENIRISFCPYVRNDKETLHGPSNAKWLARTVKYAQMSPSIVWREYYFSKAGFPRAHANIIAQDLRFINKHGIKEVTSEHSWSDRPGKGRKSSLQGPEFFDITGLEFWTITQLFWDPWQEPGDLRAQYLRRVYKEAAPHVAEFYKLIHDSWLNDPSASAFNDDYRSSTGRYIVKKNLVAPCRAALAKAGQAVKDPVAAEQLRRLNDTFEAWLIRAKAAAVAEQLVPKVEFRGIPDMNFKSGVWLKAATLPRLKVMGNMYKMPSELTTVKLFHNGENLYIAVRCRLPQGKTSAVDNLPVDAWPKGDHVELFICRRDGSYYHLVYNTFADTGKCRYDALGTNAGVDIKWDVKSRFKHGVWSSVAVIPFKSIGIIPEQDNRVQALIFRIRTARNDPKLPRMTASWNGGEVHSPDSFGELILAME